MKYHTHDEVLDQVVGTKDNPDRIEYDAGMQAFLIGDAIKTARLARNLTQEEFGKMMGIQAARVSKIEHGQNLTLNTIIRAFKALGLPVSLDIGETTKLTLC